MDDISLKSTVTAKSPDGARVKGLRLRRTGGRADTRGVFRRLRPNVRTVRARQSRARVFFSPGIQTETTGLRWADKKVAYGRC